MNKELRQLGEQARDYIAEKSRVAIESANRREQIEADCRAQLRTLDEQCRLDAVARRKAAYGAVLGVLSQRGMQAELARLLQVSAGYFGAMDSRMAGDALLERIALLADRPEGPEVKLPPLMITETARYLFAHGKAGGIEAVEVLEELRAENTLDTRRHVEQALSSDGWARIRVARSLFVWCPPECNMPTEYGRAVARRDWRKTYLAEEAEIEARNAAYDASVNSVSGAVSGAPKNT